MPNHLLIMISLNHNLKVLIKLQFKVHIYLKIKNIPSDFSAYY